MIRTALLIIAAITIELGLVACAAPTITPTRLPLPSVVVEPTDTPLPSATPTAIRPTATLPLPSPMITRTRTPTRPRATATATPTVIPLSPRVWDARLDALGIRLIPATIQAGQPFWRLERAEFWDEKERQGKHHIFVNVIDENGSRIIGQEITVEWPGEKLVLVTLDKPLPEYSANFPLDVNHYPPWGTLGVFDVHVNGLPSDKVIGMGLPSKNRFVVYLLTFQRTIGVK